VGGGGVAPIRDTVGVATMGAGGVLASVTRASMIKRTVGAGVVFLAALGRGVSKSIAIVTWGNLLLSIVRFPEGDPAIPKEQGREVSKEISTRDMTKVRD